MEAAQVILGHRTLTVSQVYAERTSRQLRRSWVAYGKIGWERGTGSLSKRLKWLSLSVLKLSNWFYRTNSTSNQWCFVDTELLRRISEEMRSISSDATLISPGIGMRVVTQLLGRAIIAGAFDGLGWRAVVDPLLKPDASHYFSAFMACAHWFYQHPEYCPVPISPVEPNANYPGLMNYEGELRVGARLFADLLDLEISISTKALAATPEVMLEAEDYRILRHLAAVSRVDKITDIAIKVGLDRDVVSDRCRAMSPTLMVRKSARKGYSITEAGRIKAAYAPR